MPTSAVPLKHARYRRATSTMPDHQVRSNHAASRSGGSIWLSSITIRDNNSRIWDAYTFGRDYTGSIQAQAIGLTPSLDPDALSATETPPHAFHGFVPTAQWWGHVIKKVPSAWPGLVRTATAALLPG